MKNAKVRGTGWIITAVLMLFVAAFGAFTTPPEQFSAYGFIILLLIIGVGVWMLLTGLRERRRSLEEAAKPE